MKKLFGFSQYNIKLIVSGYDTWMRCIQGDEELKVRAMDGLRPKSFSQETGAECQCQPYVGDAHFVRVQDARQLFSSIPLFFFLFLVLPISALAQNVSVDQQMERNPKIMEAARMYENQFLREMVRAMRKTVPESEFMPMGQAERIFRDQLDDKTVDNWVDQGGISMAEMIHDQVVDRYFAGARAAKPQGALPLKDVKSNK